jgi:hypothetical protein
MSDFRLVKMSLYFQQSRLEDENYLMVNLYFRMIHPLTTTGLAPFLILSILNFRICCGILRLRKRQLKRFSESQQVTSNNLNALANGNSFHPRNRHEIHMTYITILIVVVFILLNMLRVILGSLEVADTWVIIKCVKAKVDVSRNLAFYKVDMVARLLMVLNSSVNFIIYCGASKKFQVSIHNEYILHLLQH